MPDLLVKLYELPDAESPLRDRPGSSIKLRRALAYEKQQVVDWVRAEFGIQWASECDVAFCNSPISCYIAIDDGAILGFACYDSTSLGMFGPLGVRESARRQGIGRRLLLASLHAMEALGYAYAIIDRRRQLGRVLPERNRSSQRLRNTRLHPRHLCRPTAASMND